MHKMLDLSMVCFPYVVMGVGQVVIAGTQVKVRKVENVEEHRGRRVTHTIILTTPSSIEEIRLPGPPVLLPS